MEKKTVMQYFCNNMFNISSIFDLSANTQRFEDFKKEKDPVKMSLMLEEHMKEEFAKTVLCGIYCVVFISSLFVVVTIITS